MKIKDFGILRIEIAALDEVKVYDPNSLTMGIIQGTLRPLDMARNPEWISDISGQAGLQYRSSSMVVNLTPQEMERFIKRNLGPAEFHILAELFGEDAFEIHSDFYNPMTGEALQPIE